MENVNHFKNRFIPLHRTPAGSRIAISLFLYISFFLSYLHLDNACPACEVIFRNYNLRDNDYNILFVEENPN